MFERLSYVGYTALFCLPPLVLLWLRREFFEVLRARLRPILLSTLLLTAYGSLIWPIALRRRAWAYGADRITGVELFGYVYLDDVVWWLLIGLLFASFIALSTHYEDGGVDIVSREARELLASFANAFRGLRIIPRERNSTIHVAVAVFVLLEALLFRLSATEWILVALAIGVVLGAELMNGAVERLASRASARELRAGRAEAPSGEGGSRGRAGEAREPEADPGIGLIKDAAAAAVLVCAAAAAAVGLLIFLRRFLAALF